MNVCLSKIVGNAVSQLMEYRELGRTGWKISAISFGAWAIGGSWGAVDDKESLVALHRALERGVNFKTRRPRETACV